MGKTYTGIDIGSSTLKMAVCDGGSIRKIALEELPEGLMSEGRITSFEAMADFIKAAARRSGGMTKHAAFVIPQADCVTRRIQMPAMSVRDLEINLPYEFRDYITPVSYTHLDVYKRQLLTRAVEEVGDELAFASSVEVTGADPTFVSPTTKQPVTIGNDADGSGIVLVPQDAGDDSAFDPVLLVASSHGLTGEVFDVAFNDDRTDNGKKNTWDFRIDIKQQGRDTVIASTAMTVAWIG